MLVNKPPLMPILRWIRQTVGGSCDRFGATVGTKLGKNRRDMELGDMHRDSQSPRDYLIGGGIGHGSEVELEDAGLNDAAFIEEQEEGDEDVTDIIGDVDDKEET
jgi:hypothetical protein